MKKGTGNEKYLYRINAFGIDSLKGQFVLSKHVTFLQPAWNHVFVQGWLLETHPTLPTTRVYVNNHLIGVLVGYILGVQPFGELRLGMDIQPVPTDKDYFEELVRSLNGRFIGILMTESTQMIYPDAASSLSVLYSIDYQIAGSSTLVFPDSVLRYNHRLADLCEQSNRLGGCVFPGGFTNFETIRVLRPNTQLNLASMVPVISQMLTLTDPTTPFTSVSAAAYAGVHNLIKQLMERSRIELFLTAGKDSRMLLASLGPLMNLVVFSTYFESINVQGQFLNCEVASLIARDLALNFSLRDISSDISGLISSNVVVIGYGGELSRGYLWNTPLLEKSTLNASEVCSILRYPQKKILLDVIENWLDANKNLKRTRLLDLLYLEFYLGFLTSPSLYRYDCFSSYAIAPFCSWDIIEAFMNLDEKVKLNDGYTRRFLNRYQPDLNSYVFY